MGHFGSYFEMFRLVLGQFGFFGTVCVWFWLVLGCFRSVWFILRRFGLHCRFGLYYRFGLFWLGLVCLGSVWILFWDVLAYFGLLWVSLVCWVVLGQFESYFASFWVSLNLILGCFGFFCNKYSSFWNWKLAITSSCNVGPVRWLKLWFFCDSRTQK